MLTDLFKSHRLIGTNAETHTQNICFLIRQGCQNCLNNLSIGLLDHILVRIFRTTVRNQIAHCGLAVIINCQVQRSGSLGHIHNRLNLFQLNSQMVSDFLFSRFSTECLEQFRGPAPHFTQQFNHIRRNTNCAGLVSQSARDGLPNPIGGICGESETLGAVILFCGFHQTKIALLD